MFWVSVSGDNGQEWLAGLVVKVIATVRVAFWHALACFNVYRGLFPLVLVRVQWALSFKVSPGQEGDGKR